jgi:hypothetical protein
MDSRKVVVYEFMTLDGVAEDVAGFFTEWDDHEVDAAGAAVIETQDAVILGLAAFAAKLLPSEKEMIMTWHG